MVLGYLLNLVGSTEKEKHFIDLLEVSLELLFISLLMMLPPQCLLSWLVSKKSSYQNPRRHFSAIGVAIGLWVVSAFYWFVIGLFLGPSRALDPAGYAQVIGAYVVFVGPFMAVVAGSVGGIFGWFHGKRLENKS